MDIIDKLLADELPGDRQATREARMLLGKLHMEAAEEIRKLREALEPFDDALGEDEPEYSDSTMIKLHFNAWTVNALTLGDLRRVRELLKDCK